MKTNFKFKTQSIAFAYVLLAVVFLIGCKQATDEKQYIKPDDNLKSGRLIYDFGWNKSIRVFEVDSCEYIGFSGTSDGGTSIIHKQNCKFCLQRLAK